MCALGKWPKSGKLRVHRKASEVWHMAGGHIPPVLPHPGKGEKLGGKQKCSHFQGASPHSSGQSSHVCINCPIASICSNYKSYLGSHQDILAPSPLALIGAL